MGAEGLFKGIFDSINKESNINLSLLKSPERYRKNKDKKYPYQPELIILKDWYGGGMCPTQYYLEVQYQKIKYTVYYRERHDYESLEILWGDNSHSNKYFGVASDNIFEEYNVNPTIDDTKMEDLARKWFKDHDRRLPMKMD